ncbi:uncharacterized protein At1g28695-like isoform X1 [Zingiber officinale]|uniref:uncharacterized protein At1g28695-like isoform X1 n=1 Tax=Zingiber officinale TaxID=94328 RepID=UPI001C4DA9E1|nr:uncharacterized protein At1g28695-like isoform X1 [Zingiber officinale]
MSNSGSISGHAITGFLLFVVVICVGFLLPHESRVTYFRSQWMVNYTKTEPTPLPKDELEASLERLSMPNKTLIIAVLNKAYIEQNGMLQLFLQGFREGHDTCFLIHHLLFVAVDQASFDHCLAQHLNCYKLVADGVDFSAEAFYNSNEFLDMMWRRTQFLGDVLRRGYSFIFTDMDVLWLRNPFSKLQYEGEDMLMSSDWFNGNPFDDSNFFNTGFYFASPNNGTIALFDEWYASKNSSGKNDQDTLLQMKRDGVFRRLGLKVRYLDTNSFTCFCHKSKDFGEVVTVHANCCVTVKAKLTDLTAVLEVWKANNGTSNVTWPAETGFCL